MKAQVARTFGVVALGAIAILLLLGGVVRCPTAMLFHVPCPACGTTRAARALLHLDFRAAFHANPVAPFVLVFGALLAIRVLYVIARDGDTYAIAHGRVATLFSRTFVVLALVEIVVWGLRFFGWFGGPVPV